MAITRLNHAALDVRDVAVSTAFYVDVLGFRVVASVPGQGGFFAGGAVDQRSRPRSVPDGGEGRRRRAPGAAPSASTTSRGRSTPSPSSSGSARCSPGGGRWWGRRTT